MIVVVPSVIWLASVEAIQRPETVQVYCRYSKKHRRIYLADSNQPLIGIHIADERPIARSQVGVAESEIAVKGLARRVGGATGPNVGTVELPPTQNVPCNSTLFLK